MAGYCGHSQAIALVCQGYGVVLAISGEPLAMTTICTVTVALAMAGPWCTIIAAAWILCCPGIALAVFVVVLPCMLCGTAAACVDVVLDRWWHRAACCLCRSLLPQLLVSDADFGTMLGKLNSDTATGNSCCFDQVEQREATTSMHDIMPPYHTHLTW
jgi:hypothetical protein